MTVAELNDLIARGAAQPGVREVEEMMRLGMMLEEQARQFEMLHRSSLVSTSSGSGYNFVEPPATPNADMG